MIKTFKKSFIKNASHTDIPRRLELLEKGEADLVLVLLDADGQHDPDEIPVLIKPVIEDGYDLAAGSRKPKESKKEGKRPFIRPHNYGDCYFCGGEVVEEVIELEYRWKGRLYIIEGVPVGVCQQCGEKYFTAQVSEAIDKDYIFWLGTVR